MVDHRNFQRQRTMHQSKENHLLSCGGLPKPMVMASNLDLPRFRLWLRDLLKHHENGQQVSYQPTNTGFGTVPLTMKKM